MLRCPARSDQTCETSNPAETWEDCSKCSDRADQIGSRHGSQSDANDSSAELTGSWWGCYLHSSVPSVTAVYATLRWQSARFCCRTLVSSPSTLYVSWARTSPCTEPHFHEPTRSCFLLAFYVKLSQASTRVWPVILTSGLSPVGTG